MIARLLGEAEEQLHRLELLFAHLRERPGAGLAGHPGADLAAVAARPCPDQDAAFLLALEAQERRGMKEAAAVRELALLAGHYLAARLLDLTALERAAAARDVAALAAEGSRRGEPPACH